jgi:hypothetical protein
MVLDAKRREDGATVCIKRIVPKTYDSDSPDLKLGRTNETKIGSYLSTERMLHPTNHCVPILDYFVDTVRPDVEYIVMPALRPFNNPEFRFIGEVVDFVTQVQEVGVPFVFIHCLIRFIRE